MPYFFEKHNIKLPENKKYKLTEENRQRIKSLYSQGSSIRAIAREGICSRTMVKYILFPDRYSRSKEIRKINGLKNNNYYKKEMNTKYMRKYRRLKKEKLTMNENEQMLIKKCFLIAAKAHRGQLKIDGKTPFIKHPKAVGENFRGDAFLMCIAFLHDVLENTDLTKQDLINQGVPPDIAYVVEILTKDIKEDYLQYILRVKKNNYARVIKAQDIMDMLKTAFGTRKEKYLLALYILQCEVKDAPGN